MDLFKDLDLKGEVGGRISMRRKTGIIPSKSLKSLKLDNEFFQESDISSSSSCMTIEEGQDGKKSNDVKSTN